MLSDVKETLIKKFDDQVWQIQQLARFDASFNLDGSSTVMLIDCRNHQLDPRYKSVIIDERCGIVATNKETKRLFNNWIATQPISLSTIRALQKLHHGKVKSLVYVLGDIMLVPLTGSTQYSTTWLGMHHLVDKYSYSDNETYLHLKMNEYFDQPVTLSIELRGRVFQQQFAIAQELQLTEYHLWKFNEAHFDELHKTKIYKHSLKNVENFGTYRLQTFINAIKFEWIKKAIEHYSGESMAEAEQQKFFNEVKRHCDYF